MAPRELPWTLRSLASPYQRGDPDPVDYEVVVVDNGSPTPVDEALVAVLPGPIPAHPGPFAPGAVVARSGGPNAGIEAAPRASSSG